jgi:rsbT co-antagonist protein RsbR
MNAAGGSLLGQIFVKFQPELLGQWMKKQVSVIARRGLIGEAELHAQFQQFSQLVGQALQDGGTPHIHEAAWEDVRKLLGEISTQRARQGFTPVETALFVFSVKEPLFELLRRELADDMPALIDALWSASLVFDALGLYTTEVFQRSREQVIARQQQELLELSTPVVQLWENVLALPLIGTLDSARTQIVMENLLQKIVETGAMISIIDITGVPTVDTLVAQHLLKTVAAARLMGAECIISGIRPQIAQTIVHLGVDLTDVITKATLADAFTIALARTGARIVGRPVTPAASPE